MSNNNEQDDEFFNFEINYKFPDPTDPNHFQKIHSPSSSFSPSPPSPPSIHSIKIQQSNSSKSELYQKKQSINSTHSNSHSLIDSNHDLETDWSILSLKHQSTQNHKPILPHQPNPIPPVLPINYHENQDIHPTFPSSSKLIESNPSDQLEPQHSHQISKCQLWLENLTNTSEFSYQVSENLGTSSTDQLPRSPYRIPEFSPVDSVFQPIKTKMNDFPTQKPENNTPEAKPSAESDGALLNRFLDPSMDLSSSYLDPDQLAQSKSPHPQLPDPSPPVPTLKSSSTNDSQVLPFSKTNSSSAQCESHQKTNHNADSSSHFTHTGVSSSPQTLPDSKDSRGSSRFNCGTLIFTIVLPTSIAFITFHRYSKKPAQHKLDPHHNSVDRNLVTVPDSIHIHPPQAFEQESLVDAIQIVESPPTLNQPKSIPIRGVILNDPFLVKTQREDQASTSDDQVASADNQLLPSDVQSFSSQSRESAPHSEPDHPNLQLQSRLPIVDPPQKPKITTGKDLNRISQTVDSAIIHSDPNSEPKDLRGYRDEDLISSFQDPEQDPVIAESYNLVSPLLTNQPTVPTPQLDLPEFPSISSIPTAVILIFGFLAVLKLFSLSRKAKQDSKINITSEELMYKLNLLSSSSKKGNSSQLKSLRQVTMNQIELAKLIKNLENRIRISKHVPRIELGLLAWSKYQIGDYGGSEKLWWRFWSDEDEFQCCDIDAELEKDSTGLLKLLVEYGRHSPDPILSYNMEKKNVSIDESKPVKTVNVKLEQDNTPPKVLNQKTKVSKSSSTIKKTSNLTNSNDDKRRSKVKPSIKKEDEPEMDQHEEIKPKFNRSDIEKGLEEEERFNGYQSDRTVLPENSSISYKKRKSTRNSNQTSSEQKNITLQTDSRKDVQIKSCKKSQLRSLPSSDLSCFKHPIIDASESKTPRRSSARLKKT